MLTEQMKRLIREATTEVLLRMTNDPIHACSQEQADLNAEVQEEIADELVRRDSRN